MIFWIAYKLDFCLYLEISYKYNVIFCKKKCWTPSPSPSPPMALTIKTIVYHIYTTPFPPLYFDFYDHLCSYFCCLFYKSIHKNATNKIGETLAILKLHFSLLKNKYSILFVFFSIGFFLLSFGFYTRVSD